jgi:hypothetical protein
MWLISAYTRLCNEVHRIVRYKTVFVFKMRMWAYFSLITSFNVKDCLFSTNVLIFCAFIHLVEHIYPTLTPSRN